MRDKLLYMTLLGVLRLFALLPLPVLYLLSDGAFAVLYHVVRYRRHVVLKNLRYSFPDKDKREIRRIEKAFFHHLCDCMVETIKLLHISDDELHLRVEVKNGDLVNKLASDGHPVVLYVGHYGNWEWVPVITHHFTPLDFNGQIYRPIRDKVMDRLMLRLRSRFSPVCIPQKKVFRMLMAMSRNGTQFVVAFLADQRPNSQNLNHWTHFLHQDTAYAAGGDEIGQRTNAHYIYVETEKTGRGRYKVSLRSILPSQGDGEAHPYVLSFLRMLEETIRRAPEYWLWSHKRWRFPLNGITT